MKKLLLALALFLLPSVALAQCNGAFGASQACGSVSGGPPGPIAFSSITNSAIAPGTANQVAYYATTGSALSGSTVATIGPSAYAPYIGFNVHGIPSFNSNNDLLITGGTGPNNEGMSLSLFRQNGAIGSPTTTLSGDEIGFMQSFGWDGTSFGVLAGNPTAIVFVATQNFTTSAHGQGILFQATANGSVTAGNEACINSGITVLAASEFCKPGLGIGTITAENGVFDNSNRVLSASAPNMTITQNSGTSIGVGNSSAGTGALTGFVATNGSGSGTFGVGGTGYTAFSSLLQNKSFVYSQPALGGIILYSEGAKPIDFYVNGTRGAGITAGGIFSATNAALTTPTGIVKGDVGLSNVANVDTTNAANISSGSLSPARLNLAQITNSLGGNVAMNVTANYFDGPSMAQGTTGTWFASGNVSVGDTSASAQINCKLWDGTTVIDSSSVNTPAANLVANIALSGFLATPAANIRISCRDVTSVNGLILSNGSGNSKDSTLSAFRIQ